MQTLSKTCRYPRERSAIKQIANQAKVYLDFAKKNLDSNLAIRYDYSRQLKYALQMVIDSCNCCLSDLEATANNNSAAERTLDLNELLEV